MFGAVTPPLSSFSSHTIHRYNHQLLQHLAAFMLDTSQNHSHTSSHTPARRNPDTDHIIIRLAPDNGQTSLVHYAYANTDNGHNLLVLCLDASRALPGRVRPRPAVPAGLCCLAPGRPRPGFRDPAARSPTPSGRLRHALWAAPAPGPPPHLPRRLAGSPPPAGLGRLLPARRLRRLPCSGAAPASCVGRRLCPVRACRLRPRRVPPQPGQLRSSAPVGSLAAASPSQRPPTPGPRTPSSPRLAPVTRPPCAGYLRRPGRAPRAGSASGVPSASPPCARAPPRLAVSHLPRPPSRLRPTCPGRLRFGRVLEGKEVVGLDPAKEKLEGWLAQRKEQRKEKERCRLDKDPGWSSWM
ncbi:hypothetical protein VPH35_001342 [Triticum aestivum]